MPTWIFLLIIHICHPTFDSSSKYGIQTSTSTWRISLWSYVQIYGDPEQWTECKYATISLLEYMLRPPQYQKNFVKILCPNLQWSWTTDRMQTRHNWVYSAPSICCLFACLTVTCGKGLHKCFCDAFWRNRKNYQVFQELMLVSSRQGGSFLLDTQCSSFSGQKWSFQWSGDNLWICHQR